MYVKEAEYGFQLDSHGSGLGLVLGIFLFTTASRTALEPRSFLSNGYQGLFPWG